MPSVNTRADVTTRVRPEAQERQATQESRDNQAVEVSDRQEQQAVEVTPTNQASGRVREATATPTAPTVPQVSSEMVAQQRQQPQAQQGVASQQVMSRNAQASGLAASQGVSSGRVPTLDISDIGRLGTQSARPAAPTGLQAMNASISELANANAADRGIMSYVDPISSVSERRLIDQDRISRRQLVEQIRAGGDVMPATQAITSEAEVEAASEKQDTGRPDTSMNRPAGWRRVKQEPRLRQPSQRRHRSVSESEKNRTARQFSNDGVGYHVYGKVNGYARLNMQDVGVGTAEIFAAMQQDPSMLTRLFSKYTDDVPNLSELNVTELAKFVNSNDIWVATFKPPDNRSQDAQSRRLRVIEDHARGIYLNPIMAAMYTADFDGDDMTVSFDPDVRQMVLDPMEQLIDIFGDQTLNTDFLYVARIYDTPDMKARDYVRMHMLSSIPQADWRTVTPLIDAILRLGETEGNDKLQAAAWGDVFRQARAVSNRLYSHSIERSNLAMSWIVRGVYNGMYDLYINRILNPLTMSALSMPDPVSYEDKALYEVLDGIVEGKAPNNFQDLKSMLTGYLGEVSGKNASFRFTADVGKVTKMDTRLQIGNGDFVVDPNDDSQMKSLFETTMKYAYSHRMAVGYKKAGHSTYYTQVIKERVMSEVGMPDAYSSYKSFIDAFVESYSTASSVINQANMTIDSAMKIVGNPTAISVLKASEGGMTASDIAGPLIDVYGLHSVGKMFPHLAESGIMTGEVDPRWKGKPGHVTNLTKYGGDVSKAYEREYENSVTEFWVTNRYSQWSLRKFAHENHLLRQHSDTKISAMDSMDNTHIELAIISAIADKKTGTASKFNEKTYGIERPDGSINYDGTTVGMTAILLDDINRLDSQGALIKPGYYAGIGSRQTPADVQAAMTRVAQRLAALGWTMRSGHAGGADQAFERGSGPKSEIYLPTSDFNGGRAIAGGRVINFDDMPESDRKLAEESVRRHHPSGRHMSSDSFGFKAHRRNYFQVVGSDGAPDSAFIACWTNTADGKSHGTDQAIRIAKSRGIPVFNAFEYEDLSQWEDDVINAAMEAESNQLRTAQSSNQVLFTNDTIDALITSNPDMFHYFNMDSPAGFLASPYSKVMLDARHNMDVLGGIRLAMVAEWRMERITALKEQLSSISRDNMQLYATAWNNLQLAKDELGAASEVWHGIIRELEMEDTPGEKSVFQMMREKGTLYKTSIASERYEWTADGKEDAYYARKFWQSMGESDTLLSVIQDTSMGVKEKTAIIADVVRYWENDFYLKSYEVGFQMEVGNDSSYSLGSQGQKGALKTYREFEQAFNHWGKVCQEKLQEDVDKAEKKFRKKKGALMRTLSNLASHPEVLVDIDDHMYADAIMSSFDKNYAQSEKAKQNPWTNTCYKSLSTQWNGGVMNDIERTNDRLIGCQSAQSVSVLDIVRVLADPNESIEVYDDYGRISEPITRDGLIRSLLGHEPSLDVESDIWDIMVQNPRIASAIRMHSMSSLSNMDGSAYLGASLSISETIETSMSGYADPVKRTKFLLRDFPGYPALISLATPAYGAVTRTHRNRVMQTEQYLSHMIARAAVTSYDATAAAKWILNDLGISFEYDKEKGEYVGTLHDVMMSDYDKYCRELGIPVIKGSIEETDADADEIWETALDDLKSFIEVVREDLPQGINIGNVPPKPQEGIDISSVASYWDVMQEFNGAKTAESTGVEGSETHRWAEWISHMRPRDSFASLKAVLSDVNKSWDGLWTSEGQLSVSEDGTISINGKPVSSFDGEVVTEVPSNYVVRDKSTTRHNPVPSLFAYAVSKRSNGAETFNLKAKKSGRDKTNSVIKVKGRYKTNTDPDTGETYRASFSDMRDALQETLDSTKDLRAAQLQMAHMILDENESIGYEDLTLSNYMCIAEIMVRQTEDGRIILRTLPMLFDAIKNRIGTDSDNMSDKQLTKAVQDVVNDASDTAVGLMQLDASMVLDSFSPRSKSASVNGIRPHSSSFERNYSLLSEIERDAMRDGVLAIYERDAASLTTQNVGKLEKGKRVGGVPGVVDVFSRIDVARDYKVVGYAGARDRAGHTKMTVGPLNSIVIGDGPLANGELQQICDDAYKYGMTIFVSGAHLSEIPSEYAADAAPCSDFGDAIIPMFDIRLNGSEATPYNGGRFAIFQVDPSRYVLSVEDPLNYFQLGDAQYKPTEHFANRVHNIDNGSQQVSADDLFPNVFQNPAFANCDMAVSLASGRTISRLIANGVRCTIDYGMVPGGRGWEQRVHDVDAAIRRYQQRWNSTDSDGTMVTGTQDCQPGDIVAWAECAIIDNLTHQESYVLAPIIPFPLHGSKRGPEVFSVEQVATVDDDNTLFAVDWTNTSRVVDGNAKYFDSSGGANKGIMDFVDSIKNIAGKPLTMRDGTPVDNYVAKASTDSRKIGTDRRVKTMISLMTLARLHGYNFAESDISFPENPDIKERLRHERILTDEWRQLMSGNGIRFSSDAGIDAFLRFECRKILADGGNPSDYLAESYTDENGNVKHSRMMWEFEAMFERGTEYENQLLRFLHSMDPTFCPDGINDANEYLFRLKPNAKDFDRGVLEMNAPYPRDDGNVAYSWANVYIGMSFFGEDYSGFSRPNVSGASNFMDAMNTYSYYGLRLDKKRARFRQMWATNDMGRLPDGGAIGKA